MAANWLSQIKSLGEETVDRFSVAKIDLLTSVFKSALPSGFWGGHCLGSDGDNSQAPVYLTFDDGPDPDTTPRLLELLAATGIGAMFFLIGQRVERYPDLVRQIREAGHVVANHSYSHPFLLTLSTRALEQEIERTNGAIKDILGEEPAFFRAPYGFMDQRTGDCLKERNMKPVYWGSAPEDWSAPGTHRVVRRVLWKLTPGTVVVLHEGYGLAEQTIAAAKQIICSCSERGLRMAQVK